MSDVDMLASNGEAEGSEVAVKTRLDGTGPGDWRAGQSLCSRCGKARAPLTIPPVVPLEESCSGGESGEAGLAASATLAPSRLVSLLESCGCGACGEKVVKTTELPGFEAAVDHALE